MPQDKERCLGTFRKDNSREFCELHNRWQSQCDIKNLSEQLFKRDTALRIEREVLQDYGCHKETCILSLWLEGEPTKDGGYRSMYGGKWYQTKPVDETPECNCGFSKALSAIEEALK